MTIKAVDLFCGVGGLTYGLQKAGIPVVAGIDIDDSCEYAYTHNNNCTFIHKSVEDVTGKEIRALLRGADVKILVGCAPCQPFSSHQKDKQNRSKHKDWKLLYQFGRLVEETRPHIVSMENVPELEKEKVICGYHTIVNWDLTHAEIVTALIQINANPEREYGYDRIASRIYKFDEVDTMYLLSGSFEFVCIVKGKTMQEVAHFVASKLACVDGVTGTSTYFVLKQYKNNGVVLIEDEDGKNDRLVVTP